MLWQELIHLLLSFLLGSILFSYHLPLLIKHINIVADSSDHNPGSANVFRLAGRPMGLLCLALDMMKGFLPVWLALRRFGPFAPMLPLIIAAPVIGHAFSPWYPFQGGKAIATAFGVLIGLLPCSPAVWVLVFWYLFFSLVMVIRPNEKRSVIAFLCFALTVALISLRTGALSIAIGCALTSAVPIVKNHADIRRAQEELNELKQTQQTPTNL